MHKFGHLDGEQEHPWYYLDLYWREPTSGPERLIVAPTSGHVHWLRRLSEPWSDGYFILYVLLAPRTGREPGRYQSPPLGREALEDFLARFGVFLESDGRHHVWIGSIKREGTLVYDQHNVIYAYGPLDRYERALELAGLHKMPIEIPAPHTHRYHPRFDLDEERLMGHWSWVYSPLAEEDEP